jgi:rod shape-determining protein MreD
MSPRIKVPLVVALVVLLHVSLLADIHVRHVRPDALLLLAVLGGLVGGSERGAIIGFIAGVCADLMLQTPFGLSALVLTLLGFGVGSLQSTILRSSWWIPVVTAVVGSAVGVVLFALAGAIVGQSQLLHPGTAHLAVVAGLVALMNGILATPAHATLRWAFGSAQADRAYAR